MLTFDAAKELLTVGSREPLIYGLDDITYAFRETYTKTQRAAFERIPFTEDVLRASAGTHMLFPGFPFTLLNILDLAPQLSLWSGYEDDKGMEPFWHIPLALRWYLLRTEPVDGSLGGVIEEQLKLLGADEQVPSAATVAFAVALHYKRTGVLLFHTLCVRTSDADKFRNSVIIGGPEEDEDSPDEEREQARIDAAFDFEGYVQPYIGLASEKRPTM